MPNLFRKTQFQPLRFCAECGEQLHDEGHVDWQEQRVCERCARAMNVPIKGDAKARFEDSTIREWAEWGISEIEAYLELYARFNEKYPDTAA